MNRGNIKIAFEFELNYTDLDATQLYRHLMVKFIHCDGFSETTYQN